MLRKVILGAIIIIVTLLIWQHKLFYYGYVQAKGQLTIIWNAKPLNDFLEDETYPDSLKNKLRFVQEVKQFAFDELGFSYTENYSSMYDQKGVPLMWVVMACQPYSLEAYLWKFPIIGSFPYKGFFSAEMAKDEYKKIKSKGLDVGVRNPGGWSTLGWFNDPILSEMLDRSYGQLAELIIHELTHSTIFVKDSVTFNENLASFIGHYGTILFLKNSYPDKPYYLEEYMEEEKRYELFVQHFIRGASQLDSLYMGFTDDLKAENKQQLKTDLIESIIQNIDTLQVKDPQKLKDNFTELPNNTYFMSFLRYRSKQADFDKILTSEFGGDIRSFIEYYKLNYPFL